MNTAPKTLFASLLLSFGLLSSQIASAEDAASAQNAAEQNPAELVKEVTEKVLAKLAEDKDRLGTDKNLVNEYVNEFVLPNFDFAYMSQLVLGKYWRKATAEERSQFTDEFRTLLVRTYANSLTNYSDQEVEYLPWRAGSDPDDTKVGVEIIPQAGPSIPIDYALHRIDGKWKVYDVAVDGLSLVTNYRRSFGKKAKDDGVAALIADLKAKNS